MAFHDGRCHDPLSLWLRQLSPYQATLCAYWQLGDLARWWQDGEWVPSFLRCRDGCEHSNPLFQAERLGNMHYSVLEKLFHADMHRGRLRAALGQPDTNDIGQQGQKSSTVDDAIGAFIWSLSGSLDALAGEATLIMGYGYSIWDAQMAALKEWMGKAPGGEFQLLVAHWQGMKDALRPQLRGRPRRWSDDLATYRNAVTHRPFMLKLVRRAGPGQTQIVHLPTDPSQLPSFTERDRAYRRDDVLEFFDALWSRVADAIGAVHAVLVAMYGFRVNEPNLRNDCSLHWKPPPRRCC
jgi:hypothetical protein